jgi:O-methyltransferase
MRLIAFGSGRYFQRLLLNMSNEDTVIAVADSDKEKWDKYVCGVLCIPPSDIATFDYDRIVISIADNPRANKYGDAQVNDILKTLFDLGVSEDKIILTNNYYENTHIDARFPRYAATLLKNRAVEGSIAEAGCFRGDSACHLNAAFPDRKLYLFDSFAGYDEKQVNRAERDFVADMQDFRVKCNEDVVRLRMPHRENVFIRKGFIPETFNGLENERFAYASICLNLYEPTIASLRFFYPRMNNGGIIRYLSFFEDTYGIEKEIRRAFYDFEDEIGHKLITVPNGTSNNLLIIKQ